MSEREPNVRIDPEPPDVVSTQLTYLESDLNQVAEAIVSNDALFRALGDTTDAGLHTFRTVCLDLFWQVRESAYGVAHLLPTRVAGPLIPLQRYLWETVANLRYLSAHSDRVREATVFQAYSYLKEIEDYPEDLALITERQEILDRMPIEIVSVARARASQRPWTWSGLRIAEVATRGGLIGFNRIYAVLSGQSHAHRVGTNVRFGEVEGSSQQFRLGRTLADEEVDAHARFARKGLGAAFGVLWQSVDSPRHTFRTPDPSL